MADVNVGNNSVKTDEIKGAAGTLRFHTNKQDVGNSPNAQVDTSSVQLSQNDGSYLKLGAGGTIRMESPSDTSINANKNYFESVLGDKIVKIQRDVYTSIGGRVAINIGTQTAAERQAAEQLQTIASNIQSQGIAAAVAAVDPRIPCGVCNSMRLRDEHSKIWVYTTKYLDLLTEVPYIGPYMKYVSKFFQLVASKLSVKPAAAAMPSTMKKSCGSPGCKNHTVASPQASMNTLNSHRDNGIKSNQEEINKHQINLGKSADFLVSTKNGCVINIGLAKNEQDVHFTKDYHAMQTGSGVGQNGVYPVSIGNCPRAIYAQPVQLTDANLYVNVSEKFTVNAGAPGIRLETKGLIDVSGGSVEIHAQAGEALLSSGNKTTVSGKMIHLVANDRSGDGGIVIDSDRCHVNGNISTSKNIHATGSLSIDGAAHIPFLHCPSMSAPVTPTKTSQIATSVGYGVGSSIALRTASNTKDMIGKVALDLGWILRADNIMSFTMGLYDQVMNAITLDPIISGWCLVVTIGYSICAVGGGPAYTTGLWGGMCPVFSFYHNHQMFSMEHGGEVSVPLGNYYMTREATAGSAEHSTSPIPAPAGVKGSFPRPGPHCKPGPCGGGATWSKARNESYGLDPEDPFKGKNYVDRYVDPNMDLIPNGGPGDPGSSWWKYFVVPNLPPPDAGPDFTAGGNPRVDKHPGDPPAGTPYKGTVKTPKILNCD